MSTEINWRQQFVDLIVVILGILIAFGLSSWNEKRQAKNQANALLDGIRTELEENKIVMDKVMPYHDELLKTLREKPLEAVLSLNPAGVSDISWKLAQTNVFKENIDPEIYKNLAEAYQLHEVINLQVKSAVERMSELNVLGPLYKLGSPKMTEKEEMAFAKEMREGWIPIFESWVYFEKRYLKSVEEALEKI